MKMTMSNHAREDRADRLTYIAMTVGFGEVVVEKINGDCRECLTNTGVLIIKPLNKELMITAYICDMDKAFAIYKGAGNVGRMPSYLHQRICRNAVHLKIQNTVRY